MGKRKYFCQIRLCVIKQKIATFSSGTKLKDFSYKYWHCYFGLPERIHWMLVKPSWTRLLSAFKRKTVLIYFCLDVGKLSSSFLYKINIFLGIKANNFRGQVASAAIVSSSWPFQVSKMIIISFYIINCHIMNLKIVHSAISFTVTF